VVRHGDEALAAAETGGSQAGGELGGGRREQVERHGWDLGQCLCSARLGGGASSGGKARAKRERRVGKLSKFGRIKVELWARYLL
jgi:hypothetical protein